MDELPLSDLMGLALTSAVLASALTGGVQIILARKAREFDRERARREVYSDYILFWRRLKDRWVSMLGELPTFEEQLAQLMDEQHVVETPLFLLGSDEVKRFVGEKADAAMRGFLDSAQEAVEALPDQSSRAQLNDAITGPTIEHLAPFIHDLTDVMSSELERG